MIGSPFLDGRDRYERVIDGRIDCTHDDAFTHTVRIADPDRGVEVAVVALPAPVYEVREARCHVVRGEVSASAVASFPRIAGTRMVSGFTRRVAEATGDDRGGSLLVDAAIEVARLARQATRLPPEHARRAIGGDAWEIWQLDCMGWSDLPDSCFTYSEAGRALFATRRVTSPASPALYGAEVGQPGIFERRKVARVERNGGTLSLFHSMEDNVHGFALTYDVDAASGRITRAESATSRLPYSGICSEPQGRIASLVGERVDEGLRKRIGALLGGGAGCAQLYDLTSDLLKLLALPR